MYAVDNSARKATITLTGEEVAVKFPCTYSVFGIKGDNMLLYPKSGMAQGDDGVYDTAEGDGSVIMCLHYQADTVYIKGTGSCVIWAGNSTLDNPFKVGGKGGDDGTLRMLGATTTPLSDGATTNPITIDGQSVTAEKNDVAIYNTREFYFSGTTWSEFGGQMDTVPTKDSANAVTSDGVWKYTPFRRTGTNYTSAVGGYSSQALHSVYAIAFGDLVDASGNASAAFGHGTHASETYMIAVGKYNNPRTGDLFNVGNGSNSNNRSNIIEANGTSFNVNGDIQRDGVGIDDYTTTERKIGKWIDDSDLYQRTFEITSGIAAGWNMDVLGTSDITIQDVQGYVQFDENSTPQNFPLNVYASSSDHVVTLYSVGNHDISVKIANSLTIVKAVITIKYTKPSVQANTLNTNIQQTEEPTDEMR